ncbi:hypothetical protein D3C87_272050 [compost metagenome]
MLKSNIILAIIVCLILTYITTKVFRPGTNLFFQYFILQGATFFIMISFVFLFNRLVRPLKEYVSYILSFLIAYVFLMLLLWQINGGDLFVFVQNYHNNSDFWAMVLPFAFSNICMIIKSMLKIGR